jgi:hypothetical protein
LFVNTQQRFDTFLQRPVASADLLKIFLTQFRIGDATSNVEDAFIVWRMAGHGFVVTPVLRWLLLLHHYANSSFTYPNSNSEKIDTSRQSPPN